MTLLLLGAVVGAEAQAYKQHFEVPTRNTKFGTQLGAGMEVRQADSGFTVILTAGFTKNDSLQTVYRAGSYKYLPNAPIQYTAAADSNQSGARNGTQKATATHLWTKVNGTWKKLKYD